MTTKWGVWMRKFSKNYDPGMLGELGKGAGKGGGGGGSIREAGGPFGKIGAAKEEEYFYRLERERLSELKDKLDKETCSREREIEKQQQMLAEKKCKLDRKIKGRPDECDTKNTLGRNDPE